MPPVYMPVIAALTRAKSAVSRPALTAWLRNMKKPATVTAKTLNNPTKKTFSTVPVDQLRKSHPSNINGMESSTVTLETLVQILFALSPMMPMLPTVKPMM